MNVFEYNEFSAIQIGTEPLIHYLSTLTFSKYYLYICSKELQKHNQKARITQKK